jgi:copper chaperone CopZ
MARWGRPLLWIATAIVIALVTFPYHYGPLRAALDQPQPTAPVVAQPAAQLSTVELKVSGMTCGDCADMVKERLSKLEGVKAATVDYKSGDVKVEFDAKKTTPEKIVAAFNDGSGGFKAQLAKPKAKRG